MRWLQALESLMTLVVARTHYIEKAGNLSLETAYQLYIQVCQQVGLRQKSTNRIYSFWISNKKARILLQITMDVLLLALVAASILTGDTPLFFAGA